MNILEMLDELQQKAKKDENLRRALLDTKEDPHPVDAFCKVCQKYGHAVYVMDLIDAGENFYATMRRSTNGGGENSPKLKGEDDFYELFLAALE